MENQELADKMVSNFINNFQETFGVKPKVFYNINLNVPTLNEIFDCVNNQYKLINPNRNISDRHKETVLLKYRYLYYNVAKSFGYTYSSIGKLTGQDHSTVLHGCKQISETNQVKAKIIELLNHDKTNRKQIL